MAEGGVVDLETQRTEVSTLLKTPLRRGDTWYLIDSRWFKQWKKYVGFDSWDKYQMGDQNVYPGPIDNSGLLKDMDTQSLKEHLIDELDYILLPTEGWNKLVSWYTVMESQEPIARKVVEQGMFVKHCKVEVYLTELKLCENGNLNNVVTRRFSKADTIDMIEKEMRTIFNIPEKKETRLWNKYMSNTFEPLTKPESTIQDAGLYQGQMLVIEQKTPDGQWPRGSSPKHFVWKHSVKNKNKNNKVSKTSARSTERFILCQDDLDTLEDLLMSVYLKADSDLPTVIETCEQIILRITDLDQGGENGPTSNPGETISSGDHNEIHAVPLAKITKQLNELSQQMLCHRESETAHHAECMAILKGIGGSLEVIEKQSLISVELRRRELDEREMFQSQLLEIEREKLIIKQKKLAIALSAMRRL